jgi:hypothetical protein
MAPTTAEFPNAYLLVDVTPSGTTVRLVPVLDSTAMERAYAERVAGNDNMRVGAAMGAAQLAAAPLDPDSGGVPPGDGGSG